MKQRCIRFQVHVLHNIGNYLHDSHICVVYLAFFAMREFGWSGFCCCVLINLFWFICRNSFRDVFPDKELILKLDIFSYCIWNYIYFPFKNPVSVDIKCFCGYLLWWLIKCAELISNCWQVGGMLFWSCFWDLIDTVLCST